MKMPENVSKIKLVKTNRIYLLRTLNKDSKIKENET